MQVFFETIRLVRAFFDAPSLIVLSSASSRGLVSFERAALPPPPPPLLGRLIAGLSRGFGEKVERIGGSGQRWVRRLLPCCRTLVVSPARQQAYNNKFFATQRSDCEAMGEALSVSSPLQKRRNSVGHSTPTPSNYTYSLFSPLSTLSSLHSPLSTFIRRLTNADESR